MKNMKDMEDNVRIFLAERGWDDLRPSDVAKSIVIESAELLELFQWASLTIGEVKADQKKMEKLKRELADVMIYCFQMAVLLGLDTRKIMEEKLALSAEKYPAKAMLELKAKAKDPGTEEAYLKIKEEYRRKGLS